MPHKPSYCIVNIFSRSCTCNFSLVTVSQIPSISNPLVNLPYTAPWYQSKEDPLKCKIQKRLQGLTVYLWSLWCYHSNETSLLVLSNDTHLFSFSSAFYKTKSLSRILTLFDFATERGKTLFSGGTRGRGLGDPSPYFRINQRPPGIRTFFYGADILPLPPYLKVQITWARYYLIFFCVVSCAKSHKISWKIMNAGKRHFGHWSSIGQWNPVNADTAKRTCRSVRIIPVFIRLLTPVFYYVFLALSSADRGLFVSEGGWGEREKKRVLAIFRLLSGSIWPGEKRLFWGERRLGLGWSARGLKGTDKKRIASKSGCWYQAGSQKTKTVMDTCFINLKTCNKGRTIRKVMRGGGGGGGGEF